MPQYGQKAPVGIVERSEGGDVEPMLGFEDGGEHFNQIPWDHAYLHEGVRFVNGSFNEAVANDAAIEIVIKPGTLLNAHSVLSAQVGGNSTAELYEGATHTGGSIIDSVNLNRESANTADTVVTILPTTTDIGSAELIGSTFITGGTGGNATGGSLQDRPEFILKRDTEYLYRVTNISGSAKPISISLDFYEHEPVGIGVI